MPEQFICPDQPCINHKEYGNTGKCFYHFMHPSTDNKVVEKKPKAPNKLSGKRKEQMAEYLKEAIKWKKEHPKCEINLPGCKGNTSDVHHTRGKEGKRLLDKTHWKAACRHCHTIITEKSSEAIKQGHSKNKHKK